MVDFVSLSELILMGFEGECDKLVFELRVGSGEEEDKFDKKTEDNVFKFGFLVEYMKVIMSFGVSDD